MKKLLEALTGKKIKFVLPQAATAPTDEVDQAVTAEAEGKAAPELRAGWGMEYRLTESYTERRDLHFAAGVIRTEDGREIAISFELNLSQEFARRLDLTVRAGDAAFADPLIVNFDGTLPLLDGEQIVFDLDCDGSEEQVYFVAPDKGFLALDADADGIIGDGSELFGPRIGNGFAELAQYDAERTIQFTNGCASRRGTKRASLTSWRWGRSESAPSSWAT